MEFNLQKYIKEQEHLATNDGNRAKMKLIERLIHRCAFMQYDQILMVFELGKIITSKIRSNLSTNDISNSNSVYFSNNNDNNYDESNNHGLENEINLSLNSNLNLTRNENFENPQPNSVWDMEEKGIFLCFFCLKNFELLLEINFLILFF